MFYNPSITDQITSTIMEKWDNTQNHKAPLSRQEVISIINTDDFRDWWFDHKNGTFDDYYIYKTNRLFCKRLIWLVLPVFIVIVGSHVSLSYIIGGMTLIIILGILILYVPYKNIGKSQKFSNFDVIFFSVILLSTVVFTISVNWDNIISSIDKKIEASKEERRIKKEKEKAEWERIRLKRQEQEDRDRKEMIELLEEAIGRLENGESASSVEIDLENYFYDKGYLDIEDYYDDDYNGAPRRYQ